VVDFDSQRFRQVLGLVPTSVVVVTGVDANGVPHGITIGSFVSVSLDPPLIGFLPGVSSRTWAFIAASGRFTVNVLGASQGELCWRFAKESDDRFADVDWSPSYNGCPRLAGSIVVIDCDLESNAVHGDHHFAVGRVTHLDAAGEENAMAFYRGKVVSVSPAG
jgi:3-hydroxy-9,10-secoandrosta-1,3,5(10)-triene-9,17-dione monooxygenase reductase component